MDVCTTLWCVGVDARPNKDFVSVPNSQLSARKVFGIIIGLWLTARLGAAFARSFAWSNAGRVRANYEVRCPNF